MISCIIRFPCLKYHMKKFFSSNALPPVRNLHIFFFSGYNDSTMDPISLFSLAAESLRYQCIAELWKHCKPS